MVDKFKPPPFNYCDYRCDRCDEMENCVIYKENQERILNHYLKAEDPNDPEVFLKDLKEIFKKTENMIRLAAEKQDINLNEIPDEGVAKFSPQDYLLYRLAHQYSNEAHKLIKRIELTGIPQDITEEFQDFAWYHTLIPAKVGRLVSGFFDEFDEIREIDEQGTLKVINKGIDLSKKSLQKMLNELPDYLYEIANLMNLLKQIEEQIQTDIHQK